MEKPEAILSAALTLFVQYGFHGTPTSRIASEAGVSNGTLFHYFKTKDDLVVALYSRVKERLNAHLAAHIKSGDDIQAKFKALFVFSVHWSMEHKEEFYFIQQFHFSPHLALISKEEVQKQTQLHSGLLQSAVKAGILKPLPVELIGTLIGSQICGLQQYLLEAKLPAAKQNKLIEAAFQVTLDMILK
jgi:AcrR family transcriptional regulator